MKAINKDFSLKGCKNMWFLMGDNFDPNHSQLPQKHLIWVSNEVLDWIKSPNIEVELTKFRDFTTVKSVLKYIYRNLIHNNIWLKDILTVWLQTI